MRDTGCKNRIHEPSGNKSETRISKSETNSKFEYPPAKVLYSGQVECSKRLEDRKQKTGQS
jgi:hypothetical protein